MLTNCQRILSYAPLGHHIPLRELMEKERMSDERGKTDPKPDSDKVLSTLQST